MRFYLLIDFREGNTNRITSTYEKEVSEWDVTYYMSNAAIVSYRRLYNSNFIGTKYYKVRSDIDLAYTRIKIVFN